ncbi:MAG: polyprenyl synthetase family protein [bacterium]
MLKQYLKKKQQLIEKALDVHLPGKKQYPEIIHQAMRYSVFAGGKRIRPILVLMANEVCGGRDKDVLPLACAIEMIHNYSLVHDDLPAMDNDDYRRGKLTCHKKFDEATAILAGDALLTRAFEVMAKAGYSSGIIREVAKAIGTEGMVGGQVAELVEKKRLSAKTNKQKEEAIKYVHHYKTGALIKVCLTAGAMAAKASKQKVSSLEKYGENLGLAFQITDDILDVKQDGGVFGEFTYTGIYGIHGSQEIVHGLVEHAKQEVDIFGQKAKMLKALADLVATRKK